MPKAAGMQLLLRIWNSPGAPALGGTRGLLATTRRGEPGFLIDELADLSIDQRNKSKFGRLDLLPEAKMKISHHKSTNNVVMRQRTKRVQLRDAAGVYRCS